ncbi:MAG: MBL fold metallo-hydrolase [Parvibaculaceae bacterium]|nr:MBL fold metallo-hydrolase [Parvibaculaceae bacterium]
MEEFIAAGVVPKRWHIGDVIITRIVELGGFPVPASLTFADLDIGQVTAQKWLQPHFATEDGRLYISVQAFLIESRGRRIIVDTCVGNDKERESAHFNMLQGRFLEDLAEAGFPAESIDTVLCTHLHVDHVGWNTKLVDGAWVPTFANARYLFGRTEWDHWNKERHDQIDGDVLGDSVMPVVEAGLVDLVETNHSLTDEVRLIPTPGHTPGHVSVEIESRGFRAVITGDVMHHPLQCGAPDQASNFDSDREAARGMRHRFLDTYADQPVAVFGTHFAHPTAGWIKRDGQVWRFEVDAETCNEAEAFLTQGGQRWASSNG